MLDTVVEANVFYQIYLLNRQDIREHTGKYIDAL